MIKCSICGGEVSEPRYDENGKLYPVQICGMGYENAACLKAAWRNVTSALKRGVKPVWSGQARAPKASERKKRRTMTSEDRVRILEMRQKGMRIREIAEELDRSDAAVGNVCRNYELVYEEE